MDQTNEKLHTDRVSTPTSLPVVCGDHSDSCVTLSALDKEFSDDSGNTSVSIRKVSKSSMASEIFKPYVSLNGEEASNVGSVSAVKKGGSSDLPSTELYCQQTPPECELELDLSLNGEDYDFCYQKNVLGVETDETNFQSKFDCSHSVPCDCRDKNESCESTEAQNFEFDSNCNPQHNVLTLPHPIAAQSAQWQERETKDQAIQLDDKYVSSESGYIQSHDTRFSASETECLFYEEDDTDLFTNQEIPEEGERQCTPVKQLLKPLTDVEDSMAGSSVDDGNVEQYSSSDEEVDLLVVDEPNVYQYRDIHHLDYVAGEGAVAETVLFPCDSRADSMDYLSGSGDVQHPCSIIGSGYTPSDVSSGYITTSSVSCDAYLRNLNNVLLQQRFKDLEEEVHGFDLTISCEDNNIQ